MGERDPAGERRRERLLKHVQTDGRPLERRDPAMRLVALAVKDRQHIANLQPQHVPAMMRFGACQCRVVEVREEKTGHVASVGKAVAGGKWDLRGEGA